MAFLLAFFSLHSDPKSSFEAAKRMYGVEFSDEKENMFRYGVFLTNLEKIEHLNHIS